MALIVADDAAVVSTALREVGYVEGRGNRTKYGQWYGMDGVPWCFGAGTLIDTPTGSVPIESLHAADLVLDYWGSVRRVVAVARRPAERIRVRYQGSDGTVTTPEHPYWARRRLPGRQRAVAAPEWIEAGDLCVNDFVGLPVPRELAVVPCTTDLARLMGRIVGDGWVNHGAASRVYLSSAREEREEVTALIKAAGYGANVEERQTCLQYELTSGDNHYNAVSELNRRLRLFGGAKGKRLAGEVFAWPREAQEAFLEGYVSADGYVDPTGRIVATTASRQLAMDTARLARGLGFHASVQIVKRSARTAVIQGRTVNQSDCWTVAWHPTPTKRQCFTEDGFLWVPVREVVPCEPGDVYNLEVEGTSTFVADGAAVHNCAIFVSWVFAHAGYPLPRIGGARGFSYCPDLLSFAQRNGIWRPRSSQYVPKAGDPILFSFGGRRADHVGIVRYRMADGRDRTLEGNTNPAGSRTGGMVAEQNRRSSIMGYVEIIDPNGPGGGGVVPRPPASPVIPSPQPAPPSAPPIPPRSGRMFTIRVDIPTDPRVHGAWWLITGEGKRRRFTDPAVAEQTEFTLAHSTGAQRYTIRSWAELLRLHHAFPPERDGVDN